VLVDGFENFARNPTSLGDLLKPGLQSASAAANNAGSWFQHYFASTGRSTPLSQDGGLTATEGARVFNSKRKLGSPTHPLTSHGPDVPVQDLKARVINELIPKNYNGVITKFTDRATMERAIRIAIDKNEINIDRWLTSPNPNTLRLKLNPGLDNLGVGFHARYTSSGNYPVLYEGSLERVTVELKYNGSGGYLIQTAHPAK
jgi:Bacterial CdiA-CT RNAse A domain